MTTLLVLGAGINQVPIIENAKEYELKVVAIDPDESAPGLKLADYSYSIDLTETSRCLDIARRHSISGVVTLAADFPMPLLAEICQTLNLPGPRPEAVARSTDKAIMRKSFEQQGLRALRAIEVDTVAAAEKAYHSFETPVIFKPTLSSGGRGICRLELDADAELIKLAFTDASRFSRNGHVLIETLVEGSEYSVEMIAAQGQTHVIAITQKTTTEAPYYVEIAHQQPVELSDEDKTALAEAGLAAVAACGIDNAPGHAEIRLTQDGPVIMEVAARLGGGFISSHLTPISTGVDLIRATIDVALGRPPEISPQKSEGAAIVFLCPSPGVLQSISNLSDVQRDPSCVEACIYPKIGDHIPPLRNATARAGHIIARGPTANMAVANAKKLMQRIEIDTIAPTITGEK